MRRWCPVCESPGNPVAQGTGSIDGQDLVAIGRDLPGIEPTHVCGKCPTFFTARDRFYLTAQHTRSLHGIAVWPHGDRSVSIEMSEEGMIATFPDGASVLIARHDADRISTSFFRGLNQEQVEVWARRRGFTLKLVSAGNGVADLVVARPGPHFVLRVTKSWFRRNEIRRTEDGIYYLERIGVEPVLFPPLTVHA